MNRTRLALSDNIDDTQITYFFKLLAKKDEITRTKAITDLLQYLKQNKQTIDWIQILPVLIKKIQFHMYDVSRNVREHVFIIVRFLLRKGKINKKIEKLGFLPSLLSRWIILRFDPAPQVAEAATKAFFKVFPEEKRDEAVYICLDLLIEDLFKICSFSERVLGDPRRFSKQEIQERTERIVSSGLFALGFVINFLTRSESNRADVWISTISTNLHPNFFETLLSSRITLVRKGASDLISHIIRSEIVLSTISKECLDIWCSYGTRKVAPTGSRWMMLVSLLGTCPQYVKQILSNDTFLEQLCSVIESDLSDPGSTKAAAPYISPTLRYLTEVLSTSDDRKNDVSISYFCDPILESVRIGLASSRSSILSESIIDVYFDCLKVILSYNTVDCIDYEFLEASIVSPIQEALKQLQGKARWPARFPESYFIKTSEFCRMLTTEIQVDSTVILSGLISAVLACTIDCEELETLNLEFSAALLLFKSIPTELLPINQLCDLIIEQLKMYMATECYPVATFFAFATFVASCDGVPLSNLCDMRASCMDLLCSFGELETHVESVQDISQFLGILESAFDPSQKAYLLDVIEHKFVTFADWKNLILLARNILSRWDWSECSIVETFLQKSCETLWKFHINEYKAEDCELTGRILGLILSMQIPNDYIENFLLSYLDFSKVRALKIEVFVVCFYALQNLYQNAQAGEEVFSSLITLSFYMSFESDISLDESHRQAAINVWGMFAAKQLIPLEKEHLVWVGEVLLQPLALSDAFGSAREDDYDLWTHFVKELYHSFEDSEEAVNASFAAFPYPFHRESAHFVELVNGFVSILPFSEISQFIEIDILSEFVLAAVQSKCEVEFSIIDHSQSAAELDWWSDVPVEVQTGAVEILLSETNDSSNSIELYVFHQLSQWFNLTENVHLLDYRKNMWENWRNVSEIEIAKFFALGISLEELKMIVESEESKLEIAVMAFQAFDGHINSVPEELVAWIFQRLEVEKPDWRHIDYVALLNSRNVLGKFVIEKLPRNLESISSILEWTQESFELFLDLTAVSIDDSFPIHRYNLQFIKSAVCLFEAFMTVYPTRGQTPDEVLSTRDHCLHLILEVFCDFDRVTKVLFVPGLMSSLESMCSIISSTSKELELLEFIRIDSLVNQFSSPSPAVALASYHICSHILCNNAHQQQDEDVDEKKRNDLASFHITTIIPVSIWEELLSGPPRVDKEIYNKVFGGHGFFVRRYFLIWKLLIDIIEVVSVEMRSLVCSSLNSDYRCFYSFLDETIEHLSIADAHSVSFDSDVFSSRVHPGDLEPMFPSYNVPEASYYKRLRAIRKYRWFRIDECCYLYNLSSKLYFRILKNLPALSRTWWNNCNRALITVVSKMTAKHFSPTLIAEEFDYVRMANDLANDGLSISVNPAINCISGNWSKDEVTLKMSVKLPQEYPLKAPEVKLERCIGAREAQVRRWELNVASILNSQNGSIRESLSKWVHNVANYFDMEVCPICYSLVGPDNKLPETICSVCNHKFHARCLYTWFDNSVSSTCPLCRSLF